MLLRSLRPEGLFSFAPGTDAIKFGPLSLVIGPNGSGKSNLIEIINILKNTPTGFSSAVRQAGGIQEILWKGGKTSTLEVTAVFDCDDNCDYVYNFRVTSDAGRPIFVYESIHEDLQKMHTNYTLNGYTRNENGEHFIERIEELNGPRRTKVESYDISRHESVLSQRKDPETYPELHWVESHLSRIQIFRDWSLGQSADIRHPQPADLPNDVLLPDALNLGLIINRLEHTGAIQEFNHFMKKYLPRYQRVTTLVQGGTVQIFLHEEGLQAPISATRLSDGTMRFLAMAALLLMPDPPPLICIEEPELGLHPDAMALMAELLKKASERTQIIVTTHSEALVSAFSDQPESVLVCEHQGGTKLTRLDPERLAHWLENYSLGDVWRMGELGGNP